MNKNEHKDMELRILNRNNILKWILVFVIVVFIIIGTFLDKIIINLTNFSFSDLIAIMISLWAVYISMLFYHKNNEASAEFYNNFYVFIKDVTEKIGKLDVGVNEKLTYLKDGFFRPPTVNEEIKAEKEKYQQNEKEKQRIIDDLIRKSEMDKVEKDRLINTLTEMDYKLQESRNKIENSNEVTIHNELQEFARYISSSFPMKSLRRLVNGDNSVSLVQQYNHLISQVPRNVLDILRKYGFINSNGIINQEGYNYIESFLSN